MIVIMIIMIIIIVRKYWVSLERKNDWYAYFNPHLFIFCCSYKAFLCAYSVGRSWVRLKEVLWEGEFAVWSLLNQWTYIIGSHSYNEQLFAGRQAELAEDKVPKYLVRFFLKFTTKLTRR